MKYQKGQSGNPQGRPKGSKNKVKSRLLDALTSIVEDYIVARKQMQEDLDSLEPQERVKAVANLIGYLIPKQQAVKADVTDEREQIVITNLSSESISTLERIKRDGLNGLAS